MAEREPRPSTIDARVRRRQRRRNVLQGIALLGGMALVFALIAWMFLGLSGLITVVIGGLVLTLARPRVPTDWMLRMYKAQRLPERASPQLHHVVEVLSERAGLKHVPTLYYVPSSTPNAFVTGHGSDTALALTDGILRRLSGRQLVGVLAHEISHIRAGDTRIMNLADVLARLTQAVSYAGMALVFLTLPLTLTGDLRPLVASAVLTFLPTIMTLMQMGLSRSREYEADLAAASLTGDPEGLASGLEALEQSGTSIWERLMVPRRRSPDPTMLSSHPPTEERARRLRELRPADERRLDEDYNGRHRGRLLRYYPRVVEAPRLRPPGIRW